MSEFNTPINKILLDDKITIPPSPFLNRLGYNTGVELFRSPRALLRTPWAFKVMTKGGKPDKKSRKAEADLLQRVSHPNIAVSSKHSKIQCLGMEGHALFVGEMIERKIGNNYEEFLPKQILKVAADIASALDYLHTKVQILHGDIRSYNILVKGKFEICELCDFTSTVPLDENGVFDKQKAGQAVFPGVKKRWSAPEVMHGGEISCKADIWSLGLALFEMLTLMPPHAVPGCTCGAPPVTDENYNPASLANYYTGRYGTRPAMPVNVSEKQYMHALVLFYWCTETEPAKRLSARHLCDAATDMLDHLHYGVWFPHLKQGQSLCLKS